MSYEVTGAGSALEDAALLRHRDNREKMDKELTPIEVLGQLMRESLEVIVKTHTDAVLPQLKPLAEFYLNATPENQRAAREAIGFLDQPAGK